MGKTSACTAVLLLLPFGSCSLAYGQAFTLQNADVVSGELIEYQEGAYRVRSKFGILTIPLEDVASAAFNAEGGVLRC